VLIPVRVQPRASRNRVAGVQLGALRLALTAPPVDGEANAAAAAFMAGLLGIPKSRLTIASGEKSRDKVLLAEGLTLDEAAAKLAPYVSRT
jgi:uncharacterized protein (TIGR00251 family)